MVRAIRKLVRRHRERLLSLVMLPAFFLATLPHTACICADGHREAVCRAAACQGLSSNGEKASCCGCSCCKGNGSQDVRACCTANHQPAKQSSPVDGLSKPSKCCHPVVEVPAPATTANKTKQAADALVVVVVHPVPVIVSTVVVGPSIGRDHSSTPPPVDAVIVYLHLTI